MEPDWDLHAVVKGFTAIKKIRATTVSASLADVDHSGSSGAASLSNKVVKRTESQKHYGSCSTNLAVAELHELCSLPYLIDPRQTKSVQPTISSYLAALQAYEKRTEQQHRGDHLYEITSALSAPTPNQPTSKHKPKRRKTHLKKICHVPAEALSSDVWSWRKYGQKPIKGSPYPRSYYKCSSLKACLARKQVERNRTYPNMFIVTYIAEHNHPAPTHKNSKAGTTRNPIRCHPHLPQLMMNLICHDESNLPTSKLSFSSSMATMSPGGSLDDAVLQQSKENESMAVDTGGDINRTNLVDDAMEFLDMDVTDHFFEDPEKISCPLMDFCFPDQFLPNFPWMANKGSSSGDMN